MKTILVLEDEVAVKEFLRHILIEQFTLFEADTAEEALRLFIGRDYQIDLLLAEVALPTSSGIQVALLLRGILEELPVILTSGYPVRSWSDQDFADLRRLGSALMAVLQEPFEPQELLDKIRLLSPILQPSKDNACVAQSSG